MLSNSRKAAIETGFVTGPEGARLAYSMTPGHAPGAVFFGGLRSNMEGKKAQHVEALCRKDGRACLRFDYSGHGQSEGLFEYGTITRWLTDARTVVDALSHGPQFFVGSSMGGWIALLLALERPERVAGLVGISTAADFTEFVYNDLLSDEHRARMQRQGFIEVPDCHGGPAFRITRDLIEDGKRHLLLARDEISLACPIRMIHARNDLDVPWDRGLKLADRITGEDVRVTIVKNGTHQLDRPSDLDLIGNTLESMLHLVTAESGKSER